MTSDSTDEWNSQMRVPFCRRAEFFRRLFGSRYNACDFRAVRALAVFSQRRQRPHDRLRSFIKVTKATYG